MVVLYYLTSNLIFIKVQTHVFNYPKRTQDYILGVLIVLCSSRRKLIMVLFSSLQQTSCPAVAVFINLCLS